MTVTQRKEFGRTKYGEPVFQYNLTNHNGASISFLDYGCTITHIHVPDKNGELKDVCLGFDSIEEYETNRGFFGSIVGRHANRIQDASFELNGKIYQLAKNNGPNHLHGGVRGFDKYVWKADTDGDDLVFYRLSPDGEEGYPGNLNVKVIYSLLNDNTLRITYEAESDADTVVNLSNHSYFNLNGHQNGNVLDHILQIYAEEFTENDEKGLTNGVILSVAGTPFDFRTPKRIGEDIDQDDVQLRNAGGYDHNWVLSKKDPKENGMHKAAKLYSPLSGIVMDVGTTLPGMQLFSGNGLPGIPGKDGAVYSQFGGLCLETQYFPNGMACENFPSPILRKGEVFQSMTEYHFETD